MTSKRGEAGGRKPPTWHWSPSEWALLVTRSVGVPISDNQVQGLWRACYAAQTCITASTSSAGGAQQGQARWQQRHTHVQVYSGRARHVEPAKCPKATEVPKPNKLSMVRSVFRGKPIPQKHQHSALQPPSGPEREAKLPAPTQPCCSHLARTVSKVAACCLRQNHSHKEVINLVSELSPGFSNVWRNAAVACCSSFTNALASASPMISNRTEAVPICRQGPVSCPCREPPEARSRQIRPRCRRASRASLARTRARQSSCPPRRRPRCRPPAAAPAPDQAPRRPPTAGCAGAPASRPARPANRSCCCQSLRNEGVVSSARPAGSHDDALTAAITDAKSSAANSAIQAYMPVWFTPGCILGRSRLDN